MKMSIAALLVPLALCGCKKSPKSKPNAVSNAATPAAAKSASGSSAAARPPLEAGTYRVDPIHSAVFFKAQHLGAGFTYAWFRKFGGRFVVAADPRKSSIDLTVQTASVESNSEKRNKHLRSPDFFNAAQFPTASFRSTGIAKAGSGWRVAGNLTVRGRTRPVTARITHIAQGRARGRVLAGLEATVEINRHDFGVSFMKGYLSDKIIITIALEGRKE